MSLVFKIENGIIVEMYGFYSQYYQVGDSFPPSKNDQSSIQYVQVRNYRRPADQHLICYLHPESYSKLSGALPLILAPKAGEVLFRQHRGSLKSAMETVVKVESLEHLKQHIHEITQDYMQPGLPLKIEKYGKGIDDRINWNTYLVTYGPQPVGFLSGELHAT